MAAFYTVLFLSVYISSSLAHPPCICTRQYEPVCGSDGNTYASPCQLECQQAKNSALTLAYEGPCKVDTDCICTFDYKPVCGTDGNTYANECGLNCAKKQKADLEVQSQGACPDKVQVVDQLPSAEAKEQVQVVDKLPEACVCTLEYKPVCGTNGITYANRCKLNCDKKTSTTELNIYHEGVCDPTQVMVAENPKDSCTCGKEFEFVCATNNVTYANSCLLKCAGQSLKYEGPCRSDVLRSG